MDHLGHRDGVRGPDEASLAGVREVIAGGFEDAFAIHPFGFASVFLLVRFGATLDEVEVLTIVVSHRLLEFVHLIFVVENGGVGNVAAAVLNKACAFLAWGALLVAVGADVVPDYLMAHAPADASEEEGHLRVVHDTGVRDVALLGVLDVLLIRFASRLGAETVVALAPCQFDEQLV